jgi:hypothetical protein
MFQKILQKGKFSSRVVITFQVMAITGVSAGHPHTVCAVTECGQYEFWTDSGGAGDPNDPYIRRVLEPADSRQISGTVAAPVTQESCDLWLPIFHSHLMLEIWEILALRLLLTFPPCALRLTPCAFFSHFIDHGYDLSFFKPL